MKSGSELPHESLAETHKMAVVTGATAVFMRDLCSDMIKLHLLTGDDDMPVIAQVCAARLMDTPRCADLESIVDAVLSHPDGMPIIENTDLLTEIMERYAEATSAQRNGNARQYRRDTLIPSIVQSASTPSLDDAYEFIDSINQQPEFEPQTRFQQIVFNAINTMPQQAVWT